MSMDRRLSALNFVLGDPDAVHAANAFFAFYKTLHLVYWHIGRSIFTLGADVSITERVSAQCMHAVMYAAGSLSRHCRSSNNAYQNYFNVIDLDKLS